MKLSEFVTMALASGATRYKVASPRDYILEQGLLTEAVVERLEDLCREDARPLARGRTYEYVLTVQSEDLVKSSRFAVHVGGGKEEDGDAHHVDAERVNAAGPALGHMTRATVEAMKILRDVHHEDQETIRKLSGELERTRRVAMGTGRHAVELEIVKGQREERRESAQRNAGMLREVVDSAKHLLPMIAGKAGVKGAADAAWDQLRDSVTDEQTEHFAGVLGTRAARLLSFSKAERAADFLFDRVSQEEMAKVAGAFTEQQQVMASAAFAERFKARAAEAEAKAKAAAEKDKAAE